MLKTTDIIAAKRKAELISPGEMVDLRFADRHGQSVRGLSLPAHKLLYSLMEHAGPQIARKGTRHTISVAALNKGELELHQSSAEIEAYVHELVATVISVDLNIKGKPARRYGAFLSDVIKIDNVKETLEYEFSPLIRDVFWTSKHWAALSARALYAFQSGYAVRLYELVCLRQNRRQFQETFHVDDLHRRLGVPPGKLARWQDFKVKAIIRAIDEVNHLAGAVVTFEVKKRGRSVEAVTLFWRCKDKDELTETDRLLNQTRAQRSGEHRGAYSRERDAIAARARALADSMPKEQSNLLEELKDEIVY